jgi:3-isopropylmalate/(R)-2-methylmalate dehydratase small subunit
MNETIESFEGKGIAIRGNDIDTDRIIPARFMKCVTFVGLGAYAFNDERVDGEGKSKNHPFDDPKWHGNPVLVGNANFGCGSSREHAPQALKDYGIRAIIAESFAEIFAGNCSSLGIPAVVLSHEDTEALQNLVESSPQTMIRIDLQEMKVTADGREWTASMAESYRQALLDGSWDSTSVLAADAEGIERIAGTLSYV